MQQYLYERPERVQRVSPEILNCSILFISQIALISALVLPLALLPQSAQCSEVSISNFQQGQLGNGRNLDLGLQRAQVEGDDLAISMAPTNESLTNLRGDRLSSISTLRSAPSVHARGELLQQSNLPVSRLPINISGRQKQDEVLSADCFAKRNEVLKRQNQTTMARSLTAPPPPTFTGFHRIKPKVDNQGPVTAIVLNITLANNFDGEHIPKCRQDGSYDPIQCHKIGYCWCVNRYGQAIKNSAVRSGEEPDCDPSIYDSDTNSNQLVVAGISAQRMKGMLKPGSAFDTSTPNGHINFEASGVETTTLDSVISPDSQSSSSLDSQQHQQVESSSTSSNGRSHHVEPVMPLVPSDCKGSRDNARSRAAIQTSDSIWVPECDIEDERFYAEQQCHKSRVCWCVDQVSGLPLRTSEQLSSRPKTHNCTEIRRILGIPKAVFRSPPEPLTGQDARPAQDQTTTFYQGSSEYCDADKRVEFVISLSNQFRQQISEYLRQNPASALPTDLSSSNPYLVSELQVSKWKFGIMDRDMDGKIGDREWSKFKNNFKLVEKAAELDNPFKQQKSPYFALTPLLILRSQRKCWRDFLEFCGNGELVDESISLKMWLSCTEVPPKVAQEERASSRGQVDPTRNTYALSREAAIARSHKKNPFLGILKPD